MANKNVEDGVFVFLLFLFCRELGLEDLGEVPVC